ncbi:MAG: lysophospholipase [Proteobacteria bacterium]|nr:lysophospholipase [Pseudomonadota bacterium]
MSRFLGVMLLLLLAAASPPLSPALAAEAGPTAVVVLHGKLGAPDRLVADFAAQLSAAGFMVAAPEMPWSRGREFAESFDVALREIDVAVRGLRAKGAARVVVAGHSLGGNAALAYAVRYPGLDGLVCLAPAHTPEQSRQRERFAADIALAREMVASGRGQDTARFHDVNMGKPLELTVPAQSYLSYNDPDGPAVMPRNAAAIKPPLPILWIVGARDPLTRPQSSVFDLAPTHPKSRYAVIDADHKGTPTAAAGLVVEWLRGLAAAK